MPHKIDLFIGSPIEHASERIAFEVIVGLVNNMNKNAVIIANININHTQVDVIVGFEKNLFVFEIKKASTPIVGSVNGTWSQKTTTHAWASTRNYYDQAMKAGYAVKDKLSEFTGRKIHYPSTILLFSQELHPESQIPASDFKVTTLSLNKLTTLDDKPNRDGCSLDELRKFITSNKIQQIAVPAAAFSTEFYKNEQLLSNYHKSLISTYSGDTKHFVNVECNIDQGKITPDEIADLLIKNNNLLIVGPSGCAKTLIAKRTAIRLAESNRVAIYLEAKHFGNLLHPLLDEEIKLLNVDSATSLFKACKQLEQTITIIIDGYNECNPEKQNRINRCLLALCNRYSATVVIVSQEKNAGSPALNLNSVHISPPDLDIKKQIASQLCTEDSLKVLEPLLATASSGLEARIIGIMGNFQINSISKFSLFDYYTRNKLGESATAGTKALSCIARELASRISFVLSVRELDKITEKYDISNNTIQILINQGLLHKYFDKLSFGHELFLHVYSAASIVMLSDVNEQVIVNALNLPINYNNRIFLLGAIEDERLLQKVLNQITDWSLLVALYFGQSGEYCKQWVKNRYTTILNKIKEEAKQLQFTIIRDNQFRSIQINDKNLYSWTKSELALITALPELLLNGVFINEIFQISHQIDITLENEYAKLLPEARKNNISIRSDLFASIYCPFGDEGCGLSRITSLLHSGSTYIRNKNDYLSSQIKDYFDNNSWSNGTLYIALALSRFNDGMFHLFPVIIDFLGEKWRHLPYHLKNELLDATHYFRNFDSQSIQLTNAIYALPHTENIFISTNIIEALNSLGALESEAMAHKETVRAQLNNILTNKDNEISKSMASVLFNAQFDHPYASAYFTTIDELSKKDKRDFLVMAMLGAESNFFVSTAFQFLANLEDPSVAKHFEKWRINPPKEDSNFPQNDLFIYFLAHIIQAQFKFSIDSKIGSYTSIRDNALCTVAEIYYWINRNDCTYDQKKKRCENLWEYLEKNASNIAFEVIYQVIISIKNFHLKIDLTVPIIEIQEVFADRIAALSRQALLNSSNLEPLYRWDKPLIIIHHAIVMLEEFGEQLDIPLLKSMADNTEFGTSAIKAIKKLQEKTLS